MATDLHICGLCGDPAEQEEHLCASCAIDFEMDLDEWLDGPKPEND